MSQNQNGISIHFSSRYSSQNFSIELGPRVCKKEESSYLEINRAISIMRFFATSLIFTCALLCLLPSSTVVDAGAIGGAGSGGTNDDTLKSIKTTILTKDGILGDLFTGRLGREERRRGRLLDQLGGGGGEDGGGVLGGLFDGEGGLFGGEGNLVGVVSAKRSDGHAEELRAMSF